VPGRRSSRRRSVVRLAPETPVAGLPVVAVVGRPNVGKSTLFNRIVGERRAIVEDRARTTRDRLYGVAEWNDRRFVVIDTGGLESRPGDPIEERVQDQAHLAIEEADLIVFVVDAAAGLTPADQEVAELLRRASAPVIVAIGRQRAP
jgi:GTP-binding protein